MAFLRSSLDADPRPLVRAQDLILRFPSMADYAPWADLRGRSRAYLEPWEPKWADDELSKSAYKLRLRHYERELRDQTGFAFFVYRTGHPNDTLIGGLTLTNVRRGVTQSCAIGYWMGQQFAGRGTMTSGWPLEHLVANRPSGHSLTTMQSWIKCR